MEDVLSDWTRAVVPFVEGANAAENESREGVSHADLEQLARRCGGEWFHTGGGLMVAVVPIGEDHVAIASPEEITLWATGKGPTLERYEVAYQQASGYEAKLSLRADASVHPARKDDPNWQRCSADSVEAGMLVDLGDEAGRDGEPREVISRQLIGNEIYLEFNDDDPGAKFTYDERVWVRDKALESVE